MKFYVYELADNIMLKIINIINLLLLWAVIFIIGLATGMANREATAKANVYSNFYFSDEKLYFKCGGYRVEYDYRVSKQDGRITRSGKFHSDMAKTLLPTDSHIFSEHTTDSFDIMLMLEPSVSAFLGGSTAGFTWMHLNRNNLSKLNKKLSDFKGKSKSGKFKDILYWTSVIVTAFPVGYWLGSEFQNSCNGNHAKKIIADDEHIETLAKYHFLFRLFVIADLHKSFILSNRDQFGIEFIDIEDSLSFPLCPNVYINNIYKKSRKNNFNTSFKLNRLITREIDAYEESDICQHVLNSNIKTDNIEYAINLTTIGGSCGHSPKKYIESYCKAFSINIPLEITLIRSEMNKCILFREFFSTGEVKTEYRKAYFKDMAYPLHFSSFTTEEEKNTQLKERSDMDLRAAADRYYSSYRTTCKELSDEITKAKEQYADHPEIIEQLNSMQRNVWDGEVKDLLPNDIYIDVHSEIDWERLLPLPRPLLL